MAGKHRKGCTVIAIAMLAADALLAWGIYAAVRAVTEAIAQ